ncbi:hypothetical protein GCM10010357_18690 [Streptomyces luteireticuli]|uniref:Uncharacterized protein n=1 Tax=Streptomyces luteireticuli TaxID=173858 RepID=A0ABP3IDM4_9ACTN
MNFVYDGAEASGAEPHGPEPVGGRVPRGSRTGRAFEKDDVVRDTRKDRIGVVMDKVGPRYQLRPPAGGREWEAAAADMEPVPAAVRLGARVAEANAASRRRFGAVQ